MSDKLKKLDDLKSFYEAGHLSKEEYEKRKLAIIDQWTATGSDVKVSPQVKKPVNPVYADADFMHTNAASLREGEYVFVTKPDAINSHLHVTGANPDVPHSFVSAPVPIDPNRAKAPAQIKTMGETRVVYSDRHAGTADADQRVAQLEEEKKKLSWELFYAAVTNDVPRAKDLLDRGANVNQRDFDTEATPIIKAAAKGHKAVIYYMVERGADVNAQNHRGETALHEAVKNKTPELALWLVRNGADPHLENQFTRSAYDLALPWNQKELKDARDWYQKEQRKKLMAVSGVSAARQVIHEIPQDPSASAFVAKHGANAVIHRTIVRDATGAVLSDNSLTPSAGPSASPAAAPVPVPSSGQVLKIYLKNSSYKSLVVESDYTARDLAAALADKMNISKFASYLEVLEIVRGQERVLPAEANVLAAKKRWPLVLGATGNETELQCRFTVVPKRGSPEQVTQLYRDAMYGNR